MYKEFLLIHGEKSKYHKIDRQINLVFWFLVFIFLLYTCFWLHRHLQGATRVDMP